MRTSSTDKSQPHVMLRAALYLRVSTARQPASVSGWNVAAIAATTCARSPSVSR